MRRRASRPQLKRDPLGRASQASAKVARCPVRTRDRAMTKLLRWYLRLLAGLTLISCLGQLGVPAQLGAASAWGIAPGWQREIAFWDLAMYIVIGRTLRANDAGRGPGGAIAPAALQLLVAPN